MTDLSPPKVDDAAWALRILSRLGDVAFVLGLDGTVEWRREFREGATDATDAQIEGGRMLDRTHPDDMGFILADFDDLVSGRKQETFRQVRIKSAVQEGAWATTQVHAVRLADGRVAGLSRIIDTDRGIDLTDPTAPGFSIADVTPVGIAMLGLADLAIYCNPSFREATGLEPGPLAQTSEIAAAISDAAAKARREGTHQVEVAANGHHLIIGTRRLGAEDRPEVLVTTQDITELRSLQEAQRTAERLFSTAFAHAPSGMALVALDGHFLRVNPAFAEITGYSGDELLALGFPAITHPDDLDQDMVLVRQIISGQIKSYRLDKRYLHKDGHLVWVELRVAGAYNDAGTLTHFISQITDITTRKVIDEQRELHEAMLTHRATHDPLTDLPNRALLDEHLRLLIARVRRGSDTGAILYCDLDGFKAINDAHGHLVGDRVLVTAATRLLTELRETDLVARVGGDEFVVALASVDGPDGIAAVVERIYSALCQPIIDPEVGELTIGASIGVTEVSGDDVPMDLLHRADGLTYEAKRSGGGIRHLR